MGSLDGQQTERQFRILNDKEKEEHGIEVIRSGIGRVVRGWDIALLEPR